MMRVFDNISIHYIHNLHLSQSFYATNQNTKGLQGQHNKTIKTLIDFYLNELTLRLESAKCSSKSMIYYMGRSFVTRHLKLVALF